MGLTPIPFSRQGCNISFGLQVVVSHSKHGLPKVNITPALPARSLFPCHRPLHNPEQQEFPFCRETQSCDHLRCWQKHCFAECGAIQRDCCANRLDDAVFEILVLVL